MRTRLLRMVFLAGILASSPPAMAETWAELTAEHESLVRVEADLLDRRAAVQRSLDDPGIVLVAMTGDRVVAMTLNDYRDGVGLVFDWGIAHGTIRDLSGQADPLLVDPATANLARSVARMEFIELAERYARARQPQLRAEWQADLQRIEADLARVRARDATILAQRDALLADPAQAGAAGLLCFDDAQPPTGWAVFESTIYPNGPPVPIKGNAICNSWMGFALFGGGELVFYSCNMQASPPDCVLSRTESYHDERDPLTGDHLLRQADTAWVRLLPP